MFPIQFRSAEQTSVAPEDLNTVKSTDLVQRIAQGVFLSTHWPCLFDSSLARMASACVKQRPVNQGALNLIADEVFRRSKGIHSVAFQPASWCELAVSFARSSVYNSRVFDAIAHKLTVVVDAIAILTPTSLTQLAHSYASFNLGHEELWKQILIESRYRLRFYSWQELATLACAVGKVGMEDILFVKAVGQQLRKRSFSDCPRNSLGWLAKMLVKWRVQDKAIVVALASEIATLAKSDEGLTGMPSQVLCDFLSLCIISGVGGDLIFKAIESEGLKRLQQLGPRELCRLAAACVRLRQQKSQLMQNLLQEVFRRKFDGFSSKQLAQMAWCIAKTSNRIDNQTTGSLLMTLKSSLIRKGSTSSDVVLVLWSFMVAKQLSQERLYELFDQILFQSLKNDVPALRQLCQVRLEAKLQRLNWPKKFDKGLDAFLKEQAAHRPVPSRLQLQVTFVISLVKPEGVKLEEEALIEDLYPVDALLDKHIIQVNGPDHDPEDPAEALRDSQLTRLGYLLDKMWWYRWAKLKVEKRLSWAEKLFQPQVMGKLQKLDRKEVKDQKAKTSLLPAASSSSKKLGMAAPVMRHKAIQRAVNQRLLQIFSDVNLDTRRFFSHLVPFLSGLETAQYQVLSRGCRYLAKRGLVWRSLILRDFSNLVSRFRGAVPSESFDRHLYARLYQASVATGLIRGCFPSEFSLYTRDHIGIMTTAEGAQIVHYPDEPKEAIAAKVLIGDRVFIRSGEEEQLAKIIGSRAVEMLPYRSLLTVDRGLHRVYIVPVNRLDANTKCELTFKRMIYPLARLDKFVVFTDSISKEGELTDALFAGVMKFDGSPVNETEVGPLAAKAIFGLVEPLLKISTDSIVIATGYWQGCGTMETYVETIAHWLHDTLVVPESRKLLHTTLDAMFERCRELCQKFASALSNHNQSISENCFDLVSHIFDQKSPVAITYEFQVFIRAFAKELWKLKEQNVSQALRNQALEVLDVHDVEKRTRFIRVIGQEILSENSAKAALSALDKVPSGTPVILLTRGFPYTIQRVLSGIS